MDEVAFRPALSERHPEHGDLQRSYCPRCFHSVFNHQPAPWRCKQVIVATGEMISPVSVAVQGAMCGCELTDDEVLAATLIPPHPSSMSDVFAREKAIDIETALDLQRFLGTGAHVASFAEVSGQLRIRFSSESEDCEVPTRMSDLKSGHFVEIEGILNGQISAANRARRRRVGNVPYWDRR